MLNRFILLSILLSLSFGLGCQPNVRVGGKVTFDDGSPLTVGEVQFLSGVSMASGRINSDGSYTLTSQKLNDGIPPGQYEVVIVNAAEVPPSPTGNIEDTPPTILLIDEKFMSPSTSGLTCEVKGNMVIDITVTKPVKK
jgi:hypothetical protein